MAGEHNERIRRLVGDGNFGALGGGLPLPSAFRAVLQELLDGGASSTENLKQPVRTALAFKETLIMARWGSWYAFTHDIVTQLAGEKLISLALDGRWVLGPGFEPNKSLAVIPEAKITVTIRTQTDRVNRDTIALARLRAEQSREGLRQAGQLTPEREEAADKYISTLGWDIPEPDDNWMETPPGKKTRGRYKYQDANMPVKPETPEEIQEYFGPPYYPAGPSMVCTKCGQEKDKATEFEVYAHHRNRGWYMRHDCRVCRNKIREKSKARVASRQAQQ